MSRDLHNQRDHVIAYIKILELLLHQQPKTALDNKLYLLKKIISLRNEVLYMQKKIISELINKKKEGSSG